MTPPLDGISVIAFEQYGAGPFASMQLADLGAKVIKIEDPVQGGDVSRYVPPYQEGANSLFFESFNRGKRSMVLDLRVDGARAVFERLVKEADIVFSNLRGDQPAKLRIRYSDLHELNPQLVCVSLSGFGETGPRSSQGAYDYTIQGLAGWQSITGEPGGPPVKSGLSLVDFSAGYVAAIAMIAGLHAARRDGVGRDIDLSLFETALAQLTYIGTWVASRNYEPVRQANSAHQSIVPFQNFQSQDGWIVVACPKETIWRRFCTTIEHPELVNDNRFASFGQRTANRKALLAILEPVFIRRTAADWCAKFDAAGVPAGPVNTVSEALDDPQASARGLLCDLEHPILGPLKQIRSPFHSLGAVLPSLGPELGEATDELLTDLGMSAAEISSLREAGAFGYEVAEVADGRD